MIDFVKDAIEQVRGLFSGSFVQKDVVSGSVGIDIGSTTIKVMRLEKGKEKIRVFGFAIEKIVNKDCRDALSRALIAAHVAPHQCAAVSVSGQGVVSRSIELPLMNKSELESSMQFEVEKYVPFPITEVSSDYAIIQEARDKAKMSVLIAAAKNDLINQRCELAKGVNLDLKVVDLDCLALANFFTEIVGWQGKGSCIGVINIGKSVSNINILVDGVPHLSRDIFIGGNDITQRISEIYEMDYAQADSLKISPQDKEKELIDAWETVLNNLAAEIRVSLDYFEARNNMAVEKIFITGGSSRLKNIEEFLGQALGVEIKKIDYVSKISFEEGVDKNKFEENSDLLAIALGLALR
ncbi:MAG: type IV pilus assembly protein PilM [Candidatus Omnitrophota bacterium]